MFIGHATALIQSLDSSRRQYQEKVSHMCHAIVPHMLCRIVFVCGLGHTSGYKTLNYKNIFSAHRRFSVYI